MTDQIKIYIPKETSACSVGSDLIAEKINLLTQDHKHISIVRNGSWGAFWLEPFVEIEINSKRTGSSYLNKDISQLSSIEEFLDDFNKSKPFNILETEFIKQQTRLVFSRIGLHDPLDLDEYFNSGGYKGLENSFEIGQQKTIDEIKKSGLNGRGGAAFPTAIKMQTVFDQEARTKYVACNADEGDGGTFSDRLIMECDPYSLIEGMTIAAYAVGASHGYIYLRSEYPLAKYFLTEAIQKLKSRNLLGKNILGKNFTFDIELRIGAGSYVCGEETAMMESIEGKRGLVRSKPPLPAIKGLFNKPTLINNVITLASLSAILMQGKDIFSQFGSGKSIGTMPFQLCGNIKQGGLIEVPFGITLNEMIYDFGAGTFNEKPLHAVQIGGPLGIYLPTHLFDTPLTVESLIDLKGSLGHGGIIVFDDSTNMTLQAKFAMDFCQKESCGKCTPCRIGSVRGVELIDKIYNGTALKTDMILLEELCETMETTSLCAMGGMTPNPVRSIIKYFPNEMMN
ncbi:MAG: formate dehydrogenase [Gammaproteobacteria bacterium]|nr:formate dehydrogenase [Gammaproteobacteria bacterium]